MGLIKTAILTGGGIYAIKKVIKSAENRHNTEQPQTDYSRQNPNYLQGCEGFQGSPQNGSSQQGPYYVSNQQQYQGGSSCNQEQSFARGYTSQNTPPAYSQQSQGYNRRPVDNSSGTEKNYKSEKR